MKSNYECASFNCDYTTNRTDNLKIVELKEVVREAGGYVGQATGTMCPLCKQNSLIFVSEESPQTV